MHSYPLIAIVGIGQTFEGRSPPRWLRPSVLVLLPSCIWYFWLWEVHGVHGVFGSGDIVESRCNPLLAPTITAPSANAGADKPKPFAHLAAVVWRMQKCTTRCTECHFVLVHRLAEPCREKCHFGAFGANSLMARLALFLPNGPACSDWARISWLSVILFGWGRGTVQPAIRLTPDTGKRKSREKSCVGREESPYEQSLAQP
eukprot:1159418-Pelagomonas_calceolata.AAC.3